MFLRKYGILFPMIERKLLKKIKGVFSQGPKVRLAYLFGSRLGRSGPLSDYDFAVYLDCDDPIQINEIRLGLLDQLCQTLQTDNVDLVILNLTASPELKYHIIRDGKLIFEKEPFRVLVEPNILTEYFDFRSLLARHHLA